MIYNEEYFDEGIYRVGTRSEKWDGLRGRTGADVVPLWVADMDFPSPPEVQAALLQRAAHGTYGYTEICDDDYTAPMAFWQRRHGLTLAKEDLIMLPCVITGMKLALRAVTEPGDGVIILSPVYGPFRFSIAATGRTLVDCPLIRRENGRYDMDFAAVETALKNGAKALMLCNPHNPVSRNWSRDELQALIDLLAQYGAYLISDEIHADFVYGGGFTPALTLKQDKVISMCAASKTFNLAGLQQALMFCKDAGIREKINKEMEATGVRCGNLFALVGTRAAYEHGDAWLDGLMAYLDGSRKLLAELVAEHLPKAVLSPIDATYLAWLDMRAYGFTSEELAERTARAGVAFTGGPFFGEAAGEGHLRVNFGCPRRYVEEGILRLKVALEL
ncbi:MAG: pyridoxal phosphate-dependent aminotransferase [Clostridia bacterium]|nr:pyridoxal phosphate-dependent aminotransferase [Clostridia bacterium]